MVPNEPNQPTPLFQPIPPVTTGKRGLRRVLQRLSQVLERDRLVQTTLADVRQQLAVDRLVLYYFFEQWRGQVTCEALVDPSLSILGSTGADDCFNDDYAARYLAGRVRAIADITKADLDPCHQTFLESIKVKANLVVPVLAQQRLWGLLVAHHCQCPRRWSDAEVALMYQAAQVLAESPAVRGS